MRDFTSGTGARASWPIRRLRFLARINPPRSEVRGLPPTTEVSFVPMDAVGEYGGLRLEETRPIDSVYGGYTYFRDGDVLVAKITPCFENGKGAICAELEHGIGFGTTELHVLRPVDGVDKRFLFYLTISQPFRDAGTASMIGAAGQKRVPEDFIRDYQVAVPPLDEQRAIADYLDEKTAAIDALIAKKERLIGLLEERRWAVTREVIHRGLRDGLPLVKDSGVPWIGPIPKHWTLIPLKHLCCCLDGKRVPLNATERGTMQGDIPYWGANGVVDHVNEWLFDEPLVLLGEDGAPFFDRCKPVAFFVNEKVWVNNHIHVLRTSHRIDPRFLVHVLNCTEYAHFVDGTTRDKLTQAKMKEIPVALPPHEEQGEIVEFVERISRQTDAVQDRLRRQIDKLREYRQTLISAAVTGQIDVRREVEVPA